MNKITIIALLLLSMVACQDKSDPETTLRKFINYRFDGLDKKDKAMNLTTGDLRKSLEELEGEAAVKFWSLHKKAKRKIKINIKNCETEVCYLTYTLSYIQKNDKPESNYDIETKKIAKLEKVESNWLISDVSEVKTFIDSKVELK